MFVRVKRAAYAVICLLCAVMLAAAAVPALAAEDITLTLTCTEDETVLTGMHWDLYRVGERAGTEFVLTGDFAGQPLDLGEYDEETVAEAAETLKAYAVAYGVSPIASGETDENGALPFTGLTPGLYLASGEILYIGNFYYLPSALLIELTAEDLEGVTYNAYPKIVYGDRSDREVDLAVKKVWVGDEDAAESRPADITVDIYQDGTLYETVTLNEANDWTYTWSALPLAYDWTVAEREIPTNYTVHIESNEYQYLIRNTYAPPPSTETTTTESGTTVTTTTTAPPPPPETSITTTGGGGIPQTGQLWWPVLPLSAGGLLLIAAGFTLRPKREQDEE